MPQLDSNELLLEFLARSQHADSQAGSFAVAAALIMNAQALREVQYFLQSHGGAVERLSDMLENVADAIRRPPGSS